MPLLTDSKPLFADIRLWLVSMAASAGSSVPLGCRMAFMGGAPLWGASRGGGYVGDWEPCNDEPCTGE